MLTLVPPASLPAARAPARCSTVTRALREQLFEVRLMRLALPIGETPVTERRALATFLRA